MSKKKDFKIGNEFRPAPQFKTLYYTYTILGVFFGFLIWIIPFMPYISTIVSFYILTPTVLFLMFVGLWIPRYYRTIIYKLTKTEIVWRRGVWFKSTGIVPYNRITNVDISQGPISRKYGMAALKIQTAGYSAQSGASAEIKLEGIEDFEELREIIMNSIRSKKATAVETYEEGVSSPKVLNELIKIRKLLEKSRRK